jgi:hypothetical protein
MTSTVWTEVHNADLSADFEEILSEVLDCPVEDIWTNLSDEESEGRSISNPDLSTTVLPHPAPHNALHAVSDSINPNDFIRRDEVSFTFPQFHHSGGKLSEPHGWIHQSASELTPPSYKSSAAPVFIALQPSMHDDFGDRGERHDLRSAQRYGENRSGGDNAMADVGAQAGSGCEISRGTDALFESWDGGNGRPSHGRRRLASLGGGEPNGRGTHGSDRDGGDSSSRGQGLGASLTLESVLELEARLPLSAAAAALGVSPYELRRACRSLGVRRWSHRAHAAAATAVASPAARTMAYAANLRRRYGGAAPAGTPSRDDGDVQPGLFDDSLDTGGATAAEAACTAVGIEAGLRWPA